MNNGLAKWGLALSKGGGAGGKKDCNRKRGMRSTRFKRWRPGNCQGMRGERPCYGEINGMEKKKGAPQEKQKRAPSQSKSTRKKRTKIGSPGVESEKKRNINQKSEEKSRKTGESPQKT